MTKDRYKVDLRALHALCEANYARLLRLFPDYESCNSRQIALPRVRVRLDVVERSRYTTLFSLRSFAPARPDDEAGAEIDGDRRFWLAPLRMELRAYHDAGMLEVVNVQDRGPTAGRYSYPNSAMHQQDEKAQQNAFLADWLSHCLHHGAVDQTVFEPRNTLPGTEPA